MDEKVLNLKNFMKNITSRYLWYINLILKPFSIPKSHIKLLLNILD